MGIIKKQSQSTNKILKIPFLRSTLIQNSMYLHYRYLQKNKSSETDFIKK